MKVKDVMTGTPASCRFETNLAAAVEVLWNQNSGIQPLCDQDGKVRTVVTDRDISIALGTRNRRAAEVTVGEVASGRLFSCGPEDEVHAALATMAREKVRRLPVLTSEGKLAGVLSMDDLVLHSEARSAARTPELSHDEIAESLKRLYSPAELMRAA